MFSFRSRGLCALLLLREAGRGEAGVRAVLLHKKATRAIHPGSTPGDNQTVPSQEHVEFREDQILVERAKQLLADINCFLVAPEVVWRDPRAPGSGGLPLGRRSAAERLEIEVAEQVNAFARDSSSYDEKDAGNAKDCRKQRNFGRQHFRNQLEEDEAKFREVLADVRLLGLIAAEKKIDLLKQQDSQAAEDVVLAQQERTLAEIEGRGDPKTARESKDLMKDIRRVEMMVLGIASKSFGCEWVRGRFQAVPGFQKQFPIAYTNGEYTGYGKNLIK